VIDIPAFKNADKILNQAPGRSCFLPPPPGVRHDPDQRAELLALRTVASLTLALLANLKPDLPEHLRVARMALAAGLHGDDDALLTAVNEHLDRIFSDAMAIAEGRSNRPGTGGANCGMGAADGGEE
jgi:hypothetical protein